ncbi:MAG: hypothetical protein JW966_03875 [Anaerolineae bacterium]|nr:hypothetical protein [Anaerolineae bacterium]
MRETQAIIERVRQASADHQQLDLAVDPALAQLQPGQSLLARPVDAPITGTAASYLREQWIPVDVQTARITVEVPAQPVYAPGTVISLLSPVGCPIPLRPQSRHLLLIAEDTAPTPLIFLARRRLADGVAVTLVLGGQATGYPLELLPPEVEILHGETDWTWPDQVDTLTWADQVIALAPSFAYTDAYGSLFNVISQLRHQDIPDDYVCGLFYWRLACGTGACQACQVSCRGRDLLACVDGPAVDLKKVRL